MAYDRMLHQRPTNRCRAIDWQWAFLVQVSVVANQYCTVSACENFRKTVAQDLPGIMAMSDQSSHYSLRRASPFPKYPVTSIPVGVRT